MSSISAICLVFVPRLLVVVLKGLFKVYELFSFVDPRQILRTFASQFSSPVLRFSSSLFSSLFLAVCHTHLKVPESPAMKTVGRLGGKVYAAVGPQV